MVNYPSLTTKNIVNNAEVLHGLEKELTKLPHDGLQVGVQTGVTRDREGNLFAVVNICHLPTVHYAGDIERSTIIEAINAYEPSLADVQVLQCASRKDFPDELGERYLSLREYVEYARSLSQE
jgi:hypothetical protein